jgi:hypothetical protein
VQIAPIKKMSTIRIGNVVGADANKLIFGSDLIVEPFNYNKVSEELFKTCIVAIETPAIVVDNMNIYFGAYLRMPQELKIHSSFMNLMVKQNSDVFLAYDAMYIDGNKSPDFEFKFENVSVTQHSSLTGNRIVLFINNTLYIDQFSSLNTDGFANLDGFGAGMQGLIEGNGGNHGGIGMPGIDAFISDSYISLLNRSILNAEVTYGDVINPSTFGSSGGSSFGSRLTSDAIEKRKIGRGGGIIRVLCLGDIKILNNSRISSNGESIRDGTGFGGGSGGSVYIFIVSRNRLKAEAQMMRYAQISATGGSDCSKGICGGSGAGGHVSIVSLSNMSHIHFKVISPDKENPFISVSGLGVLSGGHNYLIPIALGAQAGLWIPPSQLVPAYVDAACNMSAAPKSLWTDAQIVSIALQPIHLGTIYSSAVVPAAVPLLRRNVSIAIRKSSNAVYNDSSAVKYDVIDICLTEQPAWVRQKVILCGSGNLSINGSAINGFWQIGYEGYMSDKRLHPTATAADIHDAITSIPALLNILINVYSESAAGCDGGLIFYVIFFSRYKASPKIKLLSADSSNLYTSNGDAYIDISYVIELKNFYNYQDFAASYLISSEISSILNISISIHSNWPNAVGYWRDTDIFTVIPSFNGHYVELKSLIGKLFIASFDLYPTKFGWFTSNNFNVTLK